MLAVVKARAGWAGCRLVAMVLPLLAVLGNDASVAQNQRKGGPTPSLPGAEVYFVNLQDGATVTTKFFVIFGLDRMGVAPAGSDRKDSGHHHLLIDTDLPPLDQPIPNDFNHLHFGGGQTEANITLRPGEHTLQLLLGDKDHIPHSPPIMSARIRIHVVSEMPPAPPPSSTSVPTPAPEQGPAQGAAHDHAPVRVPAPGIDTASTPPPAPGPAPALWPPGASSQTTSRIDRKSSPRGAAAHFIGLRNGDRIPTTVTLRFGVDNMDIRPVGSPTRDSGHYHLLIDSKPPPLDKPIPEDSNHLDFPDGQTQAKITLTPGEHTLQLLLGDDTHMSHDPPVMSELLNVTVGEARNRDDRVRDDRVRDDRNRDDRNRDDRVRDDRVRDDRVRDDRNRDDRNRGDRNRDDRSRDDRNRDDRVRDDRDRDEPSRRDFSPRGPSQSGLSQGSPSQNGPYRYESGPSRYGPSRYGSGPYRYGPSQYRPYGYSRREPYRYGRGWRRENGYYRD